jgi:hypothetical protein
MAERKKSPEIQSFWLMGLVAVGLTFVIGGVSQVQVWLHDCTYSKEVVSWRAKIAGYHYKLECKNEEHNQMSTSVSIDRNGVSIYGNWSSADQYIIWGTRSDTLWDKSMYLIAGRSSGGYE